MLRFFSLFLDFHHFILPMLITILTFVEILVGVLLVAVVLMQPKEAGLGAALTGLQEASFERRGAAKTLHGITIVLATVFVLTSLVLFFVA